MSSSIRDLSIPLISPSPHVSSIPPTPSSEKKSNTNKKAAFSWNKRGEVIPEGKLGKRLQLNQEDSRVHIRIIKTGKKILQKVIAEAGRILGIYVKLDDETYIYTKSLQKRLHVESYEIERAIADKRLPEFLLEHAQQTTRVLDAFEDIMKKIDHRITNGLSKQRWLEELHVIIQNRYKSPIRYNPLYLNGKVYHLGFNQSTQKVALCTLEQPVLDGSSTQSSKFTDLLSQKTRVFKTHQPGSSKKIDDKDHFLTFLYHSPSPIGIQIAPMEWIVLQDEGVDRQGYVQMKYEGNYEKCANPLKSPSMGIEKIKIDTFKILFQLSAGVHFLHKNRWIHGSIELKSIFYVTKNRSGNKTQYTHLGRFDHTRHYDRSTRALPFSTANRSTQYSHPADLEAKIRMGNVERAFELEKKQDVFSLGIVFYLILTGSFPYQFQKIKQHDIPISSILDVIHRTPKKAEEHEFPIPSTLDVSKAPKEYRDLVLGMLCDDYHLRFSMEEVCAKMETLVTRITREENFSSFKEDLKWKEDK